MHIHEGAWAVPCMFVKGSEQRRIQHRIGTKVKRVQALVDGNRRVNIIISILHLGGGLRSCRTTQRYVSDCYVYLLRRN